MSVFDGVRATLVIARLTLREAVRRRLLWALVALTALLVAVTGWGFARVAEAYPLHDATLPLVLSQLLVMIAFMFTFVLAMTAVFAAGPAIGPEVENGLLLAVLARPIRRSEVLLGRWLGLAIVIVAYALATGYLELAVVAALTSYTPSDPLVAPLFGSAESLLLLTLALLLSTRITPVASGAIAVVGFGLAWMGGVVGGIGQVLNNDSLQTAGWVSHVILPSDIFWRGAMYGLEPPASLLNAAGFEARVFRASPFFAASPPPLEWMLWGVAWLLLVLGIAIWSFRAREL